MVSNRRRDVKLTRLEILLGKALSQYFGRIVTSLVNPEYIFFFLFANPAIAQSHMVGLITDNGLWQYLSKGG